MYLHHTAREYSSPGRHSHNQQHHDITLYQPPASHRQRSRSKGSTEGAKPCAGRAAICLASAHAAFSASTARCLACHASYRDAAFDLNSPDPREGGPLRTPPALAIAAERRAGVVRGAAARAASHSTAASAAAVWGGGAVGTTIPTQGRE